MHKLFKSIFILLSVVTAFAGCSKDKPQSYRQQFFIHGDPMEMVKGAELNKTFDAKFFEGTEQVTIFMAAQFERQGKVELAGSQDEVEKREAPSDEAENTGYIVLKVENNNGEVRLTNEKRGFDVLFYKNAQGEYVGSDFRSRGSEKNSAAVLHTSVSADGNLISILMRENDGNSIIAYYLAKTYSPGKAEKGNSKYKYIGGAGLKVGWQKETMRPLDVCYSGADESYFDLLVSMAAKNWQSALGSSLKVESKKAQKFAPFSDLNQSCIYIVNSYITSGDPRYANYGITLPILDWNGEPKIADSDIMLFSGEFAKTGYSMFDDKVLQDFVITIGHEMGHWLGLDHEFNGEKSIMSYEFDSLEPTKHDIEAIRALYE